MAAPELNVSAESRPLLEPFISLPRRDPRRVELFTFLAEAVADPSGVAFEPDEAQLRWTWLNHVALVWRIDHAHNELDVVDVWNL
jgi:hypothetical protein